VGRRRLGCARSGSGHARRAHGLPSNGRHRTDRGGRLPPAPWNRRHARPLGRRLRRGHRRCRRPGGLTARAVRAGVCRRTPARHRGRSRGGCPWVRTWHAAGWDVVRRRGGPARGGAGRGPTTFFRTVAAWWLVVAEFIYTFRNVRKAHGDKLV